VATTRRPGALLLALVLLGCSAGGSLPELLFEDPATQALLGPPWRAALTNLLDVNTVPYDPDVYDGTGLLADPPGTFLRAGGGYAQPWTRDASVNSWNAASLLAPETARNTLWAVVQRQPNGRLVVQQDDQWWDQVVWVIAAWNHYAVTGDRAFLADAYEAAGETLARAAALRFRSEDGLYAGPGFFNDGIAAYPVPPATPGEEHGSFVLAYPGADELRVLSTNALHVAAYGAAAAMARELGEDQQGRALGATAEDLRARVERRFWSPARRTYRYILAATRGDASEAGPGTLRPEDYQEAAGLAFMLLFDVADPARARDVLAGAHVEPWGMVDVHPDLPRYSGERPGRHNRIVWPMVQGFWALAAAHHRDASTFAREVEKLARLVAARDGHFHEIYNARTGVPDGGWQVGAHWESQPDQTWSATAYLAMMVRGLFGMRFEPGGIELRPVLPPGWGDVTLRGVRYRAATLEIRLHGGGCAVSAFAMDGEEQPRAFLAATLEEAHTVDVTLAGGCAG